MTEVEAAREMRSLLETLVKLGGPKPSAALDAYLIKVLATSSSKNAARTSRPSVRSRPDQGSNAVSENIGELAKRLQSVFSNDGAFNAVLDTEVATSMTKSEVIRLHELVFARKKRFPKSITKQSLIEEFRSDRIAAVRAVS